MRRRRAFAPVIVATTCLALLAGCAEPAPAPTLFVNTSHDLQVPGEGPYPSSLAQVANLTLGDGGITLHLGVGWGQLRISSPGLGVDVEIDHDTLGSFDPFTDRDNSVYGSGAYTIVRLQDGDAASEDFEEFWWIGHDAGFSGPHGSSDGAAGGMLDASSGDDGFLLLTVANNVPGYTLHISDGGPELGWELGPHEDLVAKWPEPVVGEGTDTGPARVSYRRDWLVEMPGLPAAAIYAYGWSSDFSPLPVNGARAGISSSGFGITDLGDEPQGFGPGPNAGTGGYFGSGMWDLRQADHGEDLQAKLWFEMTDAGNTETSEGLAVIAMPLQPPA